MMELCRICLSENTEKDVFSLPNELKVEQTVQEVMMFCLNIELLEDTKFDTFLCKNCHSSIITFYKFKVLAHQSDKHLKSIWQCKAEDLKDEKLTNETSLDDVDIKQEEELEIPITKYEKDNDSDDNSLNEYAELEDLEDNENHAVSPRNDRNCSKSKDSEVPEEAKKDCPMCGKKVKYLQQHITNMHDTQRNRLNKKTQEKSSSCKLCNKGVKHSKRYHEKVITQTCEFCSKTFRKANDLEDHMCLHIKDKRFFCNDCNSGFYVKRVLEMHIRNKHKVLKQTARTLAVCPICGKTCVHLSDHLRTHEPKSSRSVQCKLCGKICVSTSLRAHYEFVHKRKQLQKCTICGKEVNHLKQHMLNLHSDRKFACNICPSTFPTVSLLRGHVNRHNDDCPFECDLCAKRYKQKGTLKDHILSKHFHEKKFQCPVCSKYFYAKSELKQHMSNFNTHKLSHTEERRHPCRICGGMFKRTGHRNRHEVTVHGKRIKKNKGQTLDLGTQPISSE